MDNKNVMLIWTTKTPTKPGWYWYRREGDGHTGKVLHYIEDDGEGYAKIVAFLENLKLI